MEKVNLVKEIKELKNQLSYSKNIGFLMGAGCSCAFGLPTIAELTNTIEKKLKGDSLDQFKNINNELESSIHGIAINIEDTLNQLRRIRDITNENAEKSYQGVTGESAKELDNEICGMIFDEIKSAEQNVDLSKMVKFLSWLTMQNRDFSKEIFTTNYDLLIEKSLEKAQIPYFDGFVGAFEPFFLQESIDAFVNRTDMTHNWIRLWKIHGSLGWFWKEDKSDNSHTIVRVGHVLDLSSSNELVIYPSKEKYDRSRKLPFVAYFDRLKRYLQQGELLFITSGSSFSDQHINEIIFNSLRQNLRLTMIVFYHSDSEIDNLYQLVESYLNIRVFGPTKGIINGSLVEWDAEAENLIKNSENFWDPVKKELTIGDFNNLVDFLASVSGGENYSPGASIG